MLEDTLRFLFRDQRNYVQGSDIYNTMMAKLSSLYDFSACDGLRLSVHGMISRHCKMIVRDRDDETFNCPEFNAELRFSIRSRMHFSWLQETVDPVTERREYPEELIRQECRILDRKIRLVSCPGFSPIEIAISMTKKLHEELFESARYKFWFTRLELRRPFLQEDAARMQIHFQHNFADKLTKSAVYSGESPLGSMYFSILPRSQA